MRIWDTIFDYPQTPLYIVCAPHNVTDPPSRVLFRIGPMNLICNVSKQLFDFTEARYSVHFLWKTRLGRETLFLKPFLDGFILSPKTVKRVLQIHCYLWRNLLANDQFRWIGYKFNINFKISSLIQ